MSSHQLKRKTLQRLSRRTTFRLSALVGALAGLVAVFYQSCVTGLSQLETTLVAKIPVNWWWLPWVLAPLGGLLGWSAVRLTQRFAPSASGSGIPHVKAVLLGLRPIYPLPLLTTKLGVGLMALGCGMSLGREGPTIHMGAACAAWLGARFQVPERTRKNLIAAGAGAGLAAAFNAPLAGFVFIMEELRREMSRLTYGSALVSTVASVAVARLFLGQKSAFGLNDGSPIDLKCLPVVILVGLLGGLLGMAFNQLLLGLTQRRDAGHFAPETLGLVVGAVGTLMLCWWGHLTGGGHQLTHEALVGKLHAPLGLLLTFLLVKFFFTLASYVTGVPGGLFGPLLSLGALLGSLCGQGLAPISVWSPAPEVLATVGMAGVLAGSVRAPLTGVVLIVEMTGRYHLLYALLLASWAAYSLAEFLGNEPIYEALLRRDLKKPGAPGEHEARVLEVLVEPSSELEHQSVERFTASLDLLVALIERDGEQLVPHGGTRVEAGDLLTVMVGASMVEADLTIFLEKARGY